MIRFCLATARLASAMWIGAAFLFVVTSIAEQVQPSFDADTKDTLALIRFPWYYGAGFVALAVAAVSSFLASRGRKAVSIAGGLLLAALLLMGADYVWVYRPLRDLLVPAGDARGAAFDRFHAISEWTNTAGFLLTATAAVILCGSRDAVGGRRLLGQSKQPTQRVE